MKGSDGLQKGSDRKPAWEKRQDDCSIGGRRDPVSPTNSSTLQGHRVTEHRV